MVESLIERPSTITPMHPVIQTGAAREHWREPKADLWQLILDKTLKVWLEDPSLIFDEEYPSPSMDVIQTTSCLAAELRTLGFDPPLRIVPTASGGISFEWESYPTFESLTVRHDCSLDWKQFEFGSLVGRRQSQGAVTPGAGHDAAW